MPKSKQLWVVRAGRDGVFVEEFLNRNMVAIGWSRIGDLTGVHSRQQVTQILEAGYPDYTRFQLAMNAGQVHRFLCELAIGETVLTYDPGTRLYHRGTVVGGYVFHPEHDIELRHTRSTSWVDVIDRDRLSAATRNSLGSIATIFRASEAATEEINGIGAQGSDTPAHPNDEPQIADDSEAAVRDDTVQKASDFLQDKLNRLTWDQMQDLVAGLLCAMGYRTHVSPAGPDRGKDIVASPDALGFVAPRIVVEVKHRKGTMGAPDIRSFAGGLRNHDNGLYVCTGGFTREARYEADRANHPLTLMDSAGLERAIVENYDRMDLETRTLLPLKKIYWPA